ncbi:MAG: transketolase [Thermodesulfovibrionales bacterium]|nr:transketolase [Thermodesulfovibrionales bacterium]
MADGYSVENCLSISNRVRRSILDLVHRTKSPHIGSSFSTVEILVALYFNRLNVSPDDPLNPERDRFILSKGHACSALYAVLAERGFLSKEDLELFAVDGGRLEQHPNMDLGRGIEVSTGSLGHGLSIGAGMALAAKVDKKKYGIYVLLSDGELNEGSVWEALMFAGHHRLSNLVAFVDFNKIQALGFTKDIIDLEPLDEKWRSFGWHAQTADGHDFEEIFAALNSLSTEKPNVVILHTIKGRGVSFMENKLLWHYRAPDDREYADALKELLK